MNRVLITGVPGFAASQLAKLILEKESGQVELHGTKRVRTDMYRLEKLGIAGQITYHLIEMTDAISVYNVIKKVMPDQIYHLAAQDYVKSSWDAPTETFRTNVEGVINLYQAIRQCYTGVLDTCRFPKVLFTSTSESYGYHEGRINEDTPQTPCNPYGISKASADQLARLYGRSYGIPTVVTRSFNVTGWGRNDPFVDSDFARQIAETEVGLRPGEIHHGNLKPRRTFFDVHDAVRGYKMAMDFQDSSTERTDSVFCFGAHESTSIEDLLKIMIDMAQKPVIPVQLQDRLRPIDTPDMLCDFSRARILLGWRPEIKLRDSLENLLNYWRVRLKEKINN